MSCFFPFFRHVDGAIPYYLRFQRMPSFFYTPTGRPSPYKFCVRKTSPDRSAHAYRPLPTRAARATKNPGGLFYMPDHPLRPAIFPPPGSTPPNCALTHRATSPFRPIPTGAAPILPTPPDHIPTRPAAPLFPFPMGRPAENAGNEETIRPCDK